jgi:hypothetical protein
MPWFPYRWANSFDTWIFPYDYMNIDVRLERETDQFALAIQPLSSFLLPRWAFLESVEIDTTAELMGY